MDTPRFKLKLAGMYAGLAIASTLGIVAAFGVAIGSGRGNWEDGLRWTMYMLAFASIAAIVGLIFAVPRARTDFSPAASERYSANSNLEQISDWLTKLLVGAGLVELKSLPGAMASLGDYLGSGLAVPNPEAFATSAVVYGIGIGFAAGYLWTRLRLRFLLEKSDRDAADASKTEQVMRHLREADLTREGPSENLANLREVADEAVAKITATQPSLRSAILWVDDHPENNDSIVQALKSLGIRVDLALSTQSALRLMGTNTYGLVISDLGRNEGGEKRGMAGLELTMAIREAGFNTPIAIYASRSGLRHREELEQAGVFLVTDNPTEIFRTAVRTVTGG
jgi:CheY-like chemotaxis protein